MLFMTIFRLSSERTTWINVIRPTSQDVEALRRFYPFFHPLHLEDLSSPIERPKVDRDELYLFVVLHFPIWDPVARLTRPSEVDFFVGRDYIITVHDGVLKPLQTLFETCQESADERHKLLGSSASHGFYLIVDKLVDYCFPIMRKVDANLRAIEEGIFNAEGSRIIRDIALARRDIIALRRIIRQQVPILESLERINSPFMQEELDEYFGDIVDHIRRLRDIIDENFEVISGLSDTADTLINHRLNAIIRVLTVISVIMLPLTLVSSIYGMNVSLPLSEHPMAFVFINGIMIVIAIGMLVIFRLRRWL
jgi:magnesium transporter